MKSGYDYDCAHLLVDVVPKSKSGVDCEAAPLMFLRCGQLAGSACGVYLTGATVTTHHS